MTQPSYHQVTMAPDGSTTTTTSAPLATTDPNAPPTATAPAPTTVVVTQPAPTAGVHQTVSLGAMLVIAVGAALAGGAAVYFWPMLVGEVEKAAAPPASEATENPIRRRRKAKRK